MAGNGPTTMRASHDPGAGDAPGAGGDGLVPTLSELMALRRTVNARRPPRRGRHGLAGPAPSPLRGRGMEYAESREYTIGDDARHIDWRLTARTGRTHTKLFQAERERLTLIVADTAPTLYFGTRTRFKSVQAARAGAVAVWSALRDGDRLAILRGSAREAPILPASGMRGALRALDALVRWYAQAPGDDAGLGVALEHADRLLRLGSRLLVLADPFSVVALSETRWATLAQHREVVVLLLSDPLERDPPKARLPFFAGGTRLDFDLQSVAQRERWREAFVAPLTEAQARLARAGVRCAMLSTDAPSDGWLDLFAEARR